MTKYRLIFKNALKLALEYKFLWFLSILAGLFISKNIIRIGYDIFNKITLQGSNWIFTTSALTKTDTIISSIIKAFQTSTLNVFANVFTGSLIFLGILIVLAIATYCEIMVIISLKKITLKNFITIKTIFKEALPFFWRIVGLNLIITIVFGIFFKLFSIPIIIYSTAIIPNNVAYLASIFSAIIIFVVFFAISIISILATINIIANNSHIINSLVRQTKIFWSNWLLFLELSIALFILELSYVLIIEASVSVFIMPLLHMINVLGSSPLMIIFNIIFFALVALVLIGLLLGYGIINAFQYALWWETTEQLKKKTLYRKLILLFKK